MRHPWLMIVLAALALPGRGTAQVQVFTDEASFLAAAGPVTTTLSFDADPQGNIAGTEYAGLVFTALTTSGGTQLSIAPADFFAGTPYLNVGERPFQSGDGNEDSLRIDFTGAWGAVGFRIVDGSVPAGAEQIVLYDSSLTPFFVWTPSLGASAFIGLISTTPIHRLEVYEAANDGDDVGYDQFLLAQPAAIPEPGTLGLLALGLGALAARWRRHARPPAVA